MKQLKISTGITARSKSLEKYLQDISREELLTLSEEVELSRRARLEHDQEAKERLVKANLRFVVSVAKQYQNRGLSLEDLINEGNVGLIHAAERFDETRGFKFISYAVWWIRQAIQNALDSKGRMVRIPVNQSGMLIKINSAIADFEQKHQRRPSAEELAELVGMPEDKVTDSINANNRTVSMDAPIGDSEDTTMVDHMVNDDDKADDSLHYESLSREMGRALDQLAPREKEILCMFYGIGCKEHTLDQIGQHLDLTRERVRQIKEKAIRRLAAKKNELLKSYL